MFDGVHINTNKTYHLQGSQGSFHLFHLFNHTFIICLFCIVGIGDVGYNSNDEKSEDNASSVVSSKQASRPVSAQAWVAAVDPLFNIGIDEVTTNLLLKELILKNACVLCSHTSQKH